MSRVASGTIEATGFNELIGEFERLGKTKAKKVFRKATRAAAKIVLETIRTFVPVDSGELDELWQQMRVAAIKRSRTGVGVTFAQRDIDWTEETGQDPNTAWYGGLVELGTKRQGPQSYIRTGFDVSHERANRKMIEIARRELFPARPPAR